MKESTYWTELLIGVGKKLTSKCLILKAEILSATWKYNWLLKNQLALQF